MKIFTKAAFAAVLSIPAASALAEISGNVALTTEFSFSKSL